MTHGTDPSQIEAAYRNMDFGVIAGEMTIADLKHFADTFRPTIVLVTWPTGSSSHYIAIGGVFRGKVYYQDPETGPGSCTEAEFEAAWHADGRVGNYWHWGICPWPT